MTINLLNETHALMLEHCDGTHADRFGKYAERRDSMCREFKFHEQIQWLVMFWASHLERSNVVVPPNWNLALMTACDLPSFRIAFIKTMVPLIMEHNLPISLK